MDVLNSLLEAGKIDRLAGHPATLRRVAIAVGRVAPSDSRRREIRFQSSEFLRRGMLLCFDGDRLVEMIALAGEPAAAAWSRARGEA